MELIEAYREKFKVLCDADETEIDGFNWEPIVNEHGADEVPTELLPILTPQILREASATFKTTTVVSFDGFPMRHFSLMTDECLEALAEEMGIAEITGFFPKQIKALPVPPRRRRVASTDRSFPQPVQVVGESKEGSC